MTSTTTTSDENSTIFDHRQTQEHHHQHHEQHRTHANGTTLSRRNLHRSSSLPDVSSVTSQSQSQSQSHSHSRSGSITKTSASGSSTVSSLGNTYQSGSGPFGSFLRRHNNNSNSNIIVRQPRQRGLPANCNDDDDSGHPPSDPSSSLDPPSLTSAAIAMSPPPRGSDPAVPVRGSDPEGESDDLRSLSSMGTATFRRLRETRLASRREEKAKDSDENDDPRRRRRRRSRDDVAFDSRREISSSGGGGGNVTHRGGGVRRSPRRRRIYNERYDCDRDGDNGTVGGAIGDYDWGGDDRDDGGDGCGSSVSTEYTRNGSGATGGDSFLRDGGTSRSSSQSSSSRRHPSRDHAHSRSRSRHVPPSRSGSRGRNERLRPRGRPFDYDDELAGDRFHRSRRGPTGYFRRVTATAFKTAVIFALGFLAMIRWELVDVDVARLFAGGGGTSSSSSSSSFRDVKTQIQKSFQDGERNLRGHSANRRDGTDDEDGNGVVGGDPRIRGNEWLHQQQLQRLQQLQLQQQLYLQQQSQSQSRYVGQSHLSPQSTQSRNPEDGNEQKEENEDEQADSGTDEDEDEDDDDDDASGREKLENVDLHDSQDIKLYTGEIESVEETMEAKMEQDVVAEVPETDIETREGVAGEPNTQEEKTHVFENFVDAISPPHESVLLTKDGKEDEAGASSEVLHAEAENENEIMELGSEVEPEGVLDGMEGEKQQWDEETENEQTGQHLEQREESSTLDTDSIEELERLSQQSAESDLQWEVGEVNDNLVPNNIDANEIVTPQDSLAYLDKLFKLQQSDEELNYGDPQLEKQLPPPWQQQQQQQLNQHNLLDQLHENLPVEESSHGGQLQNFQNTIHQFDQQQQESILLQQQQQQQQRLNQQDFLYQLNEELPVEESSQGGQLHNIQNNIHQFDMDLLQQQQQQQRLNQHDLMDQLHEEPPVEESSQGGQPQNFQNNIHQFDMVLLQQQQQQRLDQQDLIDQLNEEPPMEESSQGSQLQNIQNTFHQFDQQQQENIMLQQQQQQLQQQQQQRLDQQDFLYQLNEELPVEESSQGGQLQNIQNSIHQFRMLLLQQQQQQQKQQLYRQGLMDQLHDGLQVEESSYGGQLQNFQNNIHQIDQQQQERTLKERSQKQQKLQSNENKINNAIVSDGSTDSFATNLFDNHAAQKPEFAVLNRDNPNDHGLAEAGVDRGSNSAKIHHPNLVYEDRYRFNRNDISDNSNNVNLVGTNFVDQNANFDSGMIQSGNYNFGDQIGFHREIDHDYNHHMIGSSGAKYFQGGGAFPDGATDDMNSSNFFNGNNEVDNVQEVGVFPDEVNGEDNYNGLSHGNNEVNNLHRDTFLNEVNDQINSGLISNEFAAKSLGFNNQGTNRQFDPVSDVQDKFAAIENQKLDNSLGKNSDATRQLDNRFLSQEIMSNSDENLIEADANLIQITASQNFELVNKNDSSKIDQFRDTSIERQRIDPLNFYINQENFGPSVDKLDGLIEVDNELPSVEFIRNTARNFNGDEIPPSNKEHDEDAFSHTIVSDGDSGAGRIVQEQAGFSQDTSIPDEEDIQEQVHLLRGADLQGQDYQAGAGSQTQGVTQQNFGFQDVSIPQEEIISQEQVLFRQEKSSQDETESREQYNYQQFDKIHDDTDFFQGSESSLEQAEPTEEINSRQTNSLHDLEDFALDARSQEEARYQRDSKGQEKNYFLQQVKHREQSNSQQVPNPMERAGFEDEADLKKLALEVKFLTEGRDYNVEEFQSHDQTEVELEEDTESMQVSENPNRNQIDFEELMDKDEVAVGNTPESNSNAIATRSVPQNRGPRAKGRDMAADIDFSPSSEQAHASYIKENSILVGETETIGEQNDQDIGSSIQLSPTLVGNDIDVDVEIGDMRRAQNSRQEVSTFLKKSERVFDFQVKPSEPGTVMEQPVDMDAYKMSTFGGLDEGLAAGTEHTFQKSQQTNGITTKEGQHPEATGLEGHKIKRQGFPSVSEYYSSIREEPARNNMITLLQKRREQRQKLRQQQ